MLISQTFAVHIYQSMFFFWLINSVAWRMQLVDT